jgi:uncharacterized protein YfaS (alpha-2-macroglobulin family)
MANMLVLMEKGMLGLTDFQTPSPHGALHARDALAIRTQDMIDHVSESSHERTSRILRVGEAGERVIPSERRNAKRFQSVILRSGPFFLNGGKVSHTFRMPAYVGRVRVMLEAGPPEGTYYSAENSPRPTAADGHWQQRRIRSEKEKRSR